VGTPFWVWFSLFPFNFKLPLLPVPCKIFSLMMVSATVLPACFLSLWLMLFFFTQVFKGLLFPARFARDTFFAGVLVFGFFFLVRQIGIKLGFGGIFFSPSLPLLFLQKFFRWRALFSPSCVTSSACVTKLWYFPSAQQRMAISPKLPSPHSPLFLRFLFYSSL